MFERTNNYYRTYSVDSKNGRMFVYVLVRNVFPWNTMEHVAGVLKFGVFTAYRAPRRQLLNLIKLHSVIQLYCVH